MYPAYLGGGQTVSKRLKAADKVDGEDTRVTASGSRMVGLLQTVGNQ